MRDRRLFLLGLLGAVVAVASIAVTAMNRHYAKPTAAGVALAPESKTVLRFRESLKRTYGPKLYSYFDEETLIRDFFQDERDGYFVDVGASHYEKLSNTYYLEQKLGWKGIGLDAQGKYAADYLRYRPNTKYLVYFVGDRESSGKQVEFFVDLENEYSSTGVDGSVVHASKKIVVPSITLDELLDQQGVAKVDFVSMDIEDSEPPALAGFSIKRWKPRLVCVEMHPSVAGQITAYFDRNGYVRLGTYMNVDSLNGYFTPADGPAALREAERMRALKKEFEQESAVSAGSAN